MAQPNKQFFDNLFVILQRNMVSKKLNGNKKTSWKAIYYLVYAEQLKTKSDTNSKKKNNSFPSYPYFTTAVNGKAKIDFRNKIKIDILSFIKGRWDINYDHKKGTFTKNGKPVQVEILPDISGRIDDAGIINVHRDLPVEDIKQAIYHAEKQIIINESSLVDIIVWLKEPLYEALKRDIKIKIFLLHPDSIACDLRARNFNDFTENKIRLNIIQDLFLLNEIISRTASSDENLRIILYDEQPSLNAIVIDDKAWTGFYPQNITTTNYPYLEVGMGNTFSGYFNTVINNQIESLFNKYLHLDNKNLKELAENFRRGAHKHNATRFSIYEGVYKLFFCYKYPKSQELKESSFITEIGVNILKIYRDERSGIIKTKLKVPGNGIEEYEGVIKKNVDPAFLLLFLQNGISFINIVLKMDKERPRTDTPIYGIHSFTYNRIHELGNGPVVAQLSDKDYENLRPMVKNPLKQRKFLDPRIINFLMFRNRGISHPPLSKKDLPKTFKYSGSYWVYNANKKDKDRYISKSAMKIYSSGYVKHQYKRAHGFENSEGVAKIVGDVLHITIKNSQKGYTGYFIIQINNNPPPNGLLYPGIFLGQSFRNGRVISNRILLEPMQDQKAELTKLITKKVKLNTTEILKEIPDEIRQALSGRLRNTLLFREDTILSLQDLQKEVNVERNFAKIHFEGALVSLLQKDIQGCIRKLNYTLEYNPIKKDFNQFRELTEKYVDDKKMIDEVLRSEPYKALEAWFSLLEKRKN